MGNIYLPKACSSKQWLKRVQRAIGLDLIFHRMLSYMILHKVFQVSGTDESEPAALSVLRFYPWLFTFLCYHFWYLFTACGFIQSIMTNVCRVKSLKISSYLKSKAFRNSSLENNSVSSSDTVNCISCIQDISLFVRLMIERMRRGEEESAYEGPKTKRERQAYWERHIFPCISLIVCRGSVILWHLLQIFADNKSGLFPHWLFSTEVSFSLSLSLSLSLSFFLPVFQRSWAILKESDSFW